MSAPTADTLRTREPESLEETGLSESTVEQLILKILYFRGELFGQDLSAAIGLKFSVIQDIVDELKLAHIIQVKRSLGMGNVASVFCLTESGRDRVREYLETNQYYGPAPITLAHYTELVKQQRPREGWLTKEALVRAFRGLVLTEHTLSQMGPAVSSANSLLLYGKPGDGKTFLIEQLANLDTAPIFLPYAVECQGNIVQVFDPIYHLRVEEEAPSVLAVNTGNSHDRRLVKCKRPFIVTGGELSMEMLDLRFNHTSKVYEAPFQMKANNGIYLIDDFGRQRATPAEVLNRWIVPMERHTDYLSFLTGGKLTTPFETFLVFSTNLNPADLGDEAFLRRIQYKMLLRGPTEAEFMRIFETFCSSRKLPFAREVVQRFVERRFKQTNKVFRRCHPRDILSHALNLINFEKMQYVLTDQLLDRAFDSCFLEDKQDAPPVSSSILPMMKQSCADYWGDKLAQVTTAFGSLVIVASLWDRTTGQYRDADSERQFGEVETGKVLKRLHATAFRDFMALGQDRQTRDISRYVAATDGNAARLHFEQQELVSRLTPESAGGEEACLFAHNLAMALETLCPKSAVVMEPRPVAVEPVRLERTA